MKEILTAIGSTYAITSKNGCTVTYPNGDPIIEVPAGQQTLFIAQSSSILVSDEEARVTACGGSATLNFTSAAPSILSEGGSTGGLTANERSLLNGAAQREGDNTFTAANTFTGEVDMSTAQVTPPEGWNVGELTAEQVQAVVPMAWGNYYGYAPSATGAYSISIGGYAKDNGWGRNVSIGVGASSSKPTCVTIGAAFDDTAGSYKCQTQGTGSITIGAGANTLNNGDTESSNSITIGCKASNSGADSVVIGAQASGTAAAGVAIGAGAISKTGGTSIGWGAQSEIGVAIGYRAKAGDSVSVGCDTEAGFLGSAIGIQTKAALYATAVGAQVICNKSYSSALGAKSESVENWTTAIGACAKAADYGATVIRSTAEDGTYTQLYFSGANTPLANAYHDGAPMLGYVTKDSAGNIVAAGTRSLIDLLTENSTFAPASLDENGEWVMPKVFHPSDLDMPTEEPSEVEEYTPLPVWPIVEPEIEEEI